MYTERGDAAVSVMLSLICVNTYTERGDAAVSVMSSSIMWRLFFSGSTPG